MYELRVKKGNRSAKVKQSARTVIPKFQGISWGACSLVLVLLFLWFWCSNVSSLWAPTPYVVPNAPIVRGSELPAGLPPALWFGISGPDTVPNDTQHNLNRARTAKNQTKPTSPQSGLNRKCAPDATTGKGSNVACSVVNLLDKWWSSLYWQNHFMINDSNPNKYFL